MEMRGRNYDPTSHPQQVFRTPPAQKGIGDALRCSFVATILPPEMERLLDVLDLRTRD